MKKIFKVFGGLTGVIVVVFFGIVLVHVDFSNDQNLDKFIETKIEVLEAKGLAVAFLKDGNITWSKNYGPYAIAAYIKSY